MKYLLKTKGTDDIPDYLQIRDEDFQLIVHCTVKNASKFLKEHKINLKNTDIEKLVDELPFGKLTKINNA